MHLKVSRNVKTLLSAHHRNCQHIKEAIQEAIQSGCIAPAAPAAAHHGSRITSSSLKPREHMCRRNPACWMRGFKAAFAKPNGLIMLPVWLPRRLRRWWKPCRYNFTESNIIIRLATDPIRQYKGADIIPVRERVWAREKCVCTISICVLITLVHPSVKFNLDAFTNIWNAFFPYWDIQRMWGTT